MNHDSTLQEHVASACPAEAQTQEALKRDPIHIFKILASPNIKISIFPVLYLLIFPVPYKVLYLAWKELALDSVFAA